MADGPFMLFTFRRIGRQRNALRRHYLVGENKQFAYSFMRKAYKKARWRRAERRAAKAFGKKIMVTGKNCQKFPSQP